MNRDIQKRLDRISKVLASLKSKKVPPNPGRYSIAWLRSVAPSYFQLESPEFHNKIADALNDHDKIVITAPRGSAKSTVITLGYPLYTILYHKRVKYILIVSDTFSQASKLLSSIAHALDTLGVNHQASASRIVVGSTLVEALGTGCRIRGRRWRESRPELIILDDPQGHMDLISHSVRESHWDWFLRDLIPAGSRTCKYIVVGTTIHEDSIVHKLSSQWPSLTFPALSLPERLDLWREWYKLPQGERDTFYTQNKDEMEKGVTLLWRERWSLESLMEAYFSLGEDVFRSEYLQQPGLGAVYPLFLPFIDDNTFVDTIPNNTYCSVIAIDPAYSTKRSADWCAVTTLHASYDGSTIYAHCDCSKGDWVNFAVEKILLHRPLKVVVESNATMGTALQLVRDSFAELYDSGQFPQFLAHMWTSKQNKHNRIVTGIMGVIKGNRLKITRSSTELVQEIKSYPNTKHDDALDSLCLGLLYL